MKLIKALELEDILKSASTEGMSAEDTKHVVRQYLSLKPIAEKFKSEIQEAMERLKDDNIRKIEEAIKKHNEAVSSESDEGRLSQDMISLYNMHYSEYLKKVADYEKELLSEDADAKIYPLTKEGLNKFLEKNNLVVEKAAVMLEFFGDEND